ncbi:TPA: KilA-N domain-containing protein [Aeromonas dhakensis]|nr:KilA-N domain-containing protein [Aeromonas dhakensis]
MKQVESISLHFMGNTVTVNQKDGLFCLNDLHRAYTGGMSRKQKPHDWCKGILNGEKSRHYNLTTFKGKHGGTYANEQGVYAYASWLDDDFHNAVLQTFSSAARGDAEGAVKIAQSSVTLTWRETLREGNKAFCHAIYTAQQEGNVKGSLSHVMANIQSLVCKAVTGLDGTAFKNRYGMSARDFLVSQDDGKRLGLMARIEGKVEALLDAGMDYMMIKAALAKDVLKAIESWGNPPEKLRCS